VSTASDDGLRLIGCRITNAVKCLPPQNKPETIEIKQCNAFLAQEIALLKRGTALLALGTIAHQAVLLACKLKARDYPFAHGASHALPNGLVLHDSYHCSRYNTQTRRLTVEMFEAVFAAISSQLHRSTPCPTSTSVSRAL
jgi:uracil-DNA glycosylase family 4